jgi:hypothetical protein
LADLVNDGGWCLSGSLVDPEQIAHDADLCRD